MACSVKKYLSVLFIFIFFSQVINAEVKMPVIFQSNMVLQRDKDISIWGFANAGEKVRINLNDQEYKTVTGKDKKWLITLSAHNAGGPYDIVISGEGNGIVLKNILFGDVWICGG